MRRFLLLMIPMLLACNSKPSTTKNENNTPTNDTIVEETKDTSIAAVADNLLESIKDKDYQAISGVIHPLKGVRFSPYAYIDTLEQIVLDVETFNQYWTDKKSEKLVWGAYDGPDGSIELTIDEYFDRFVYDADFIGISKQSVNEVLGSGSTINNIKEAYPFGKFVEYYIPQVDPEFEGYDWRSLRLVFELYENQYFLVGIVHDQWTT